MPADRAYLATSLDPESQQDGRPLGDGRGVSRKVSGDYVESISCCHYRRRGKLASNVQLPRKMLRVWFDLGSSFAIISELLFVPDTALALLSSVASVYVWHTWGAHYSINMSWTAVSLMLAFPLQNAIREAYKRREAALHALVGFRAELLNVYLANANWDWPGAEAYEGRFEDNVAKDNGGRGMKKKPCAVPLHPEHARRVKELIFRILDALQDMLFIPRSGHPRHEFFCGRREKCEIETALKQGRKTCIRLLTRLHWSTEELKAAGLPVSEASRINQYNLLLTKNFEYLWSAKTYNTPIALRSLLRVVIQVLPFFYGPYWLYLAKGTRDFSTTRSLMFACSFSVLISALLIAMNNLEEQVENPFRNNNRDTIRVKEEIAYCREAILDAEADRECVWYERMKFEWEMVGGESLSDDSSDDSTVTM